MSEQFGKYALLESLAAGGMGEVFLAKAGAHGVQRTFAIKRILTRHAHSAEFAAMLMREARISIGLVHPNIAQIFEFGELEGHFFLAMEYVEGLSLSGLLTGCAKRNRPLPAADALSIGIQLCRGLDYAHERRDDDGQPLHIVHRDISPHNILVDTSGMVKLIDFGIAKAADSITVTETGFIKGKIAYMSPEQSRGDPQDRRDDLFSVGVVLFECLANERLYASNETSMKVLARLHDRDIPDIEGRLSDEVPPAARDALRGALAVKREDRIGTAAELESLLARARNELDPAYTGHALGRLVSELDDEGEARRERLKAARHGQADTMVDVASGSSPTISLSGVTPASTKPNRRRVRVVTAVALTVAAAVAGVALLRFVGGPAEPAVTRTKPVSILVADFDNSTGEDVFDDVLEGAITVALESAPFVSAFKRRQARSVLATIEPDAKQLDRKAARLVAQREGVEVVIAGTVSGHRPYTLAVDAIDGMTGRTIAQVTSEVSERDAVLRSIDDLARLIRAALGDTVPEATALAAAETFTTSSLGAAQAYTQAQQLARDGKHDAARVAFERAVELDPDFGRAYAGLAIIMANLHRPEEAEALFAKALARMDRMTERERLRTRSNYFIVTNNYRRAIEDLERLMERYPGESNATGNLALAHFYTRDMAAALEMGRRDVEKDPGGVLARSNLALYAMYAGLFDEALAHAKATLEVNPELQAAITCSALSALGLGDFESAEKWYDRLEKLDGRGAATAALGRADLALAQGRSADAIEILKPAIEADRAADSKPAAARKLLLLAEAYANLGRKREALAAAQGAVELTKWSVVTYAASSSLLRLGRPEPALAVAADFQKRLTPQDQALGLLLEGEHELIRGNHARAAELTEEALERDDSWHGRLLLGRTYLAAKAYAEAYAELDGCVKRRGEALSIFSDDLPTFHVFPPVYFYLGRALDGMGRADAIDSYRAFLKLRTEKDGPLVSEAMRRVAELSPSP